uniref:Uncharacterized protein n=1 Tax=Arundo donax TaxID=35708 RepID=A0A0A9E9Y5_ARUDO
MNAPSKPATTGAAELCSLVEGGSGVVALLPSAPGALAPGVVDGDGA